MNDAIQAQLVERRTRLCDEAMQGFGQLRVSAQALAIECAELRKLCGEALKIDGMDSLINRLLGSGVRDRAQELTLKYEAVKARLRAASSGREMF